MLTHGVKFYKKLTVSSNYYFPGGYIMDKETEQGAVLGSALGTSVWYAAAALIAV